MAWQKAARIVVALFVVGFVAVVVLALRRPKPTGADDVIPTRTESTSVAETRGPGEHTVYNSKDGKVRYSVKFDKQFLYADGRSKFQGVSLTLPDRNGRTFTVSGDEARTQNKPGEEVGEVHLTGSVKLTTSDGATVTAHEATYDESTGMLEVPGPVVFERGRTRGEGTGATYDKNRDVLWLLASAHVTVAPDEKGQGAIDATSDLAGMARADHYIKLLGKGHAVADKHVIDADEITVKLTEDDKRMQALELRGNSRMTGGASGPQAMSARDIDLQYNEDGRTLQHAQLRENGVVHLPGESKGPARRIAGRTIDIGMAPDGSTVTSLTATEQVQVDLPADGDLPAKQIRAATLIAAGAPPNGLQSADFAGSVDYHETRAARGSLAAIERTARAQSLNVKTKPGLGALEEADFHGNVVIRDGADVQAVAPRVLYHVERDQMDLSGPGDPGEGPRVSDGRVTVTARTIEFTLGALKLKADTKVSSSLVSRPPGRGAQAAPSAHVPSMLKQDQPVNVTANRLEYDGAEGHAQYMGNATLWQVDTTVAGDTIVVDDKTGNLEATGNVRTKTVMDDVDAETKQKKSVPTTGTAEAFFYDDSKRLATYTTNAHMIGAQGDVTADKLELFMKAGTNELDHAEGYGTKGSVIVKDESRTATGDRLTYTTADETYVLTGKPVEAIEIVPGDCKLSRGTTLRFQRGKKSIGSLDGAGDRAKGVSIPCPTERR